MVIAIAWRCVSRYSINAATFTELLFVLWFKGRIRNQQRLAEFASRDPTWIQDRQAAAAASEMTRKPPLGKKKAAEG